MFTPTTGNGIIRWSAGILSKRASIGWSQPSKGLIVFSRIDFSGDAARAGPKMNPTRLLIFGKVLFNPLDAGKAVKRLTYTNQ